LTTRSEIEEARESFIQERLAILQFDSYPVYETDAILMKEAEICWEQYRRDNKMFFNEQRKI